MRKKIWRGVKDEEKTSGRDSLKEMEESKEDELRRNEWRGREKGEKMGMKSENSLEILFHLNWCEKLAKRTGERKVKKGE